MDLRIEDVTIDTAESWRRIHNLVVPPTPLSAHDVAQRLTRNVLTLAYAGDDLVGNATIRPPQPGDVIATVIVRVLPRHRHQGYGSAYLKSMIERIRVLGAQVVATVVLGANDDGLRFAERQGFIETERYMVDGAEYVDYVRSCARQ